MTETLRIYIAGPMTGLPEYNLPAFANAQRALSVSGYDAVNPGRWGVIDGYTWVDYMRRGLRELLTCDGVAVLPGWNMSRGARLEVQVARELNLGVQSVETWLLSA